MIRDGAIELWPDLDVEDRRIESGPPLVVRNVTRPRLIPVGEPRAGAPAIVVCPGGGFHMLSMDSEGFDVAAALGKRGAAGYVLEYRLVETPPAPEEFQAWAARLLADLPSLPAKLAEFRPVFRADGRRALELVRERHPRVVMVGFSAGGMLVADLISAADDEAARPDLAAVVYAPYLAEPARVGPASPPLFLAGAADDPLGHAGMLELYTAWSGAQRPVELHIYARGGHGFGMNTLGLPVDTWIHRLADWLAWQGVLD